MPSAEANSTPWLPPSHTPVRSTRRRRSSRLRPLRNATGQREANAATASAARGRRTALSGSPTISDTVPSKSRSTTGRRNATREAIWSKDVRASGIVATESKPPRILMTVTSGTTASASVLTRWSASSDLSKAITSPNPASRAVVMPPGVGSTTTHRFGDSPRSRAAASAGPSHTAAKEFSPVDASFSAPPPAEQYNAARTPAARSSRTN